MNVTTSNILYHFISSPTRYESIIVTVIITKATMYKVFIKTFILLDSMVNADKTIINLHKNKFLVNTGVNFFEVTDGLGVSFKKRKTTLLYLFKLL